MASHAVKLDRCIRFEPLGTQAISETPQRAVFPPRIRMQELNFLLEARSPIEDTFPLPRLLEPFGWKHPIETPRESLSRHVALKLYASGDESILGELSRLRPLDRSAAIAIPDIEGIV
jgi:hypothetical protein